MALKNRVLDASRQEEDADEGGSYEALLSGMDVKTLVDLRAQIDKALGLQGLDNVDLMNELELQLTVAKAMQADALKHADSHGHMAQTVNAVRQMLQELVRMRTEVHNSERFKQLEEFIITAFQTVEVPKEAQVLWTQCKDMFFDNYERMLAKLDTENEPV